MRGIEFTPEEIVEKKAAMIAWLEESIRGTFAQACELVGICRAQGYKWRESDPQWKVDVDKAREKANESGLDFVEGELLKAIRNGNIAGIIYYLKTQGRNRGWVEKTMLIGDQNNPLQVNHVHDAERTAFDIINALADAKAGIRALPLTLDQPSAPRPDNADNQSPVEHMVDHGRAGLGQNKDGG